MACYIAVYLNSTNWSLITLYLYIKIIKTPQTKFTVHTYNQKLVKEGHWTGSTGLLASKFSSDDLIEYSLTLLLTQSILGLASLFRVSGSNANARAMTAPRKGDVRM